MMQFIMCNLLKTPSAVSGPGAAPPVPYARRRPTFRQTSNNWRVLRSYPYSTRGCYGEVRTSERMRCRIKKLQVKVVELCEPLRLFCGDRACTCRMNTNSKSAIPASPDGADEMLVKLWF